MWIKDAQKGLLVLPRACWEVGHVRVRYVKQLPADSQSINKVYEYLSRPFPSPPPSKLPRRRPPIILIHIRPHTQLFKPLIILLIPLNLIHHPLIRIAPNHHPQRRILHHRQLIHRRRPLSRIPRLRPIPLSHHRLRIHMIILLPPARKLHAPPRPVRPEPAGLHARQFDPPFGLEFVRDGLCEPLHRPFARAVDAEQRHTPLPADTRDLLNHPSGRVLLRAHALQRLTRDIEDAEEIDLHLRPDLLITVLLETAREAIPRVVDDDIDAAEVLDRGVEGGGDAGFVGDVEFEREVVFARGGVGEGELGGVAGGGDGSVAGVEDVLRVFAAEAGGGAGDEEDTRHGFCKFVV